MEESSNQDLIVRDYLAVERTVLANERTVLAYLRTSLAIIVTGITGTQYFDIGLLSVVSYVIGFLGIALLILGLIRFRTVQKKLSLKNLKKKRF